MKKNDSVRKNSSFKIKKGIILSILISIIMLLLILVETKNGVIERIITNINKENENLETTEASADIETTYIVNSTNENTTNITIMIKSDNDIDKVITPDGNEIIIKDKRKISIDYQVNLEEEYIFKIQGKGDTEARDYKLKVTGEAKPIIEQNESYTYPLITKNSVTINKKVTIDYGDSTNNYYSVDNGETWQEYTGEIGISKDCVVMAKAKTEEENVIQRVNKKEITINIASNAIPAVCYDGDSTTGVRSPSTPHFNTYASSIYYIGVSSELYGEQVNFQGRITYNSYWRSRGRIYIDFLEEDMSTTVSSQILITSTATTVNSNVTIPSETAFLKITLQTQEDASNSEQYAWLYEIWPVN